MKTLADGILELVMMKPEVAAQHVPALRDQAQALTTENDNLRIGLANQRDKMEASLEDLAKTRRRLEAATAERAETKKQLAAERAETKKQLAAAQKNRAALTKADLRRASEEVRQELWAEFEMKRISDYKDILALVIEKIGLTRKERD